MTNEETMMPCSDPEACVKKSEPCDNFEHCVKVSEPPLETVIRELRKELRRVQDECVRLGRERDLLADMYARERFENQHLREEMHEAAYELRRILFNDSKIRLSKEVRAEISKYLSF